MLDSPARPLEFSAASRWLAIALMWTSIPASSGSCFATEFDADPIKAPAADMLEDERISDSSPVETVEPSASTAPDFLFSPTSQAYIAPIIGASWATLSRSMEGERLSSANGNLFTAGGALGYTVPMERGQLRVEVESRYRDSYTLLKAREIGASAFRTGDNWSVLANTWIDFGITSNLGVYAGGGLGSGGYSVDMAAATYDANVAFTAHGEVAAFAWQAGGGAIYALNDRVHFDVGYRFYNVADGDVPVTAYVTGLPPLDGTLTTSFTASELLFSVRIYEPFGGRRPRR